MLPDGLILNSRECGVGAEEANSVSILCESALGALDGSRRYAVDAVNEYYGTRSNHC
jgi:hypothetical protein